MRTKQLAFALSLMLGVVCLLSCGGSERSAPAPSNEILYLLYGSTIATYAIDPNSLTATPIEQAIALTSGPFVQFDPSPDGRYLYDVWSDAQNVQHLSVFQTSSAGAPQVPAIQVLNADSLSQFNMHPSGKFAYMLHVTLTASGYEASIRLFNVKGTSGKLDENLLVQGRYGPAPYWPAFLYGFSQNGSKLYDMSWSDTGSMFRERPINLTTGVLGRDTTLLAVNGAAEVVIGKVIVEQHQNSVDPSQNYLDILPNAPNPSKALIRCTAAMLPSCATATNVQLDKSNHFLFLTDPATQVVHIASINEAGGKISDTGGSIPIPSQTPGFAFSPDGNILYAMATDGNVHFYHFDQNSGALSEGGAPLPIPPGAGICPADHR